MFFCLQKLSGRNQKMPTTRAVMDKQRKKNASETRAWVAQTAAKLWLVNRNLQFWLKVFIFEHILGSLGPESPFSELSSRCSLASVRPACCKTQRHGSGRPSGTASCLHTRSLKSPPFISIQGSQTYGPQPRNGPTKGSIRPKYLYGFVEKWDFEK